MYRASPGIGKIVGTGILKFKICLWPLSVCYHAFVGWKIVARGRFSRVGLSRFDARLTRPTKGFAPFWRPLGARGDMSIPAVYCLCAARFSAHNCNTVSVQLQQAHYRCLLSLCSCCRRLSLISASSTRSVRIPVRQNERAGAC